MRLTPFFMELLKRDDRLRTRGGGKKVHKLYMALAEQVQELVQTAGFDVFARGLNFPTVD